MENKMDINELGPGSKMLVFSAESVDFPVKHEGKKPCCYEYDIYQFTKPKKYDSCKGNSVNSHLVNCDIVTNYDLL